MGTHEGIVHYGEYGLFSHGPFSHPRLSFVGCFLPRALVVKEHTYDVASVMSGTKKYNMLLI